MTLNNQPIENKDYSGQTSLKAWKWEKKHWLIIIAVGCLALWWFGSQITKFSLIKPIIESLPLLGSICFATEAIIKLTQ